MLQAPDEPRLVVDAVVGVRRVATVDADHGVDVLGALHALGFVTDGPPTILTTPEPWELRFVWPVRPVAPGDQGFVSDFLEREPDVTDDDLANARRRLRPAAYGFIGSERGLLLTELSERTHAPGWWNLPGGGLDPGESPQRALYREVEEETGQVVGDVRLHSVLLRRHIARSPVAVEDFQSVRVFHVGWAAAPTDPVVHDVGGSTSRAAWVPLERIGEVPIAPALRRLVEEFVAGTGGLAGFRSGGASR